MCVRIEFEFQIAKYMQRKKNTEKIISAFMVMRFCDFECVDIL